jgi:hypothetical protein
MKVTVKRVTEVKEEIEVLNGFYKTVPTEKSWGYFFAVKGSRCLKVLCSGNANYLNSLEVTDTEAIWAHHGNEIVKSNFKEFNEALQNFGSIVEKMIEQ